MNILHSFALVSGLKGVVNNSSDSYEPKNQTDLIMINAAKPV